MKALIFFSLFIVISCQEKDDPEPIVVTGCEAVHLYDGGSFYLFTFRNEGSTAIDSFTVDVSLYEDGVRQISVSRTYREELIPFHSVKMQIWFNYVVKDSSKVTFKYRFK